MKIGDYLATYRKTRAELEWMEEQLSVPNDTVLVKHYVKIMELLTFYEDLMLEKEVKDESDSNN